MGDRREFLKLFGMGCAVVPIIGGLPVVAAEAKLIEVPKVELVSEQSLAGVAEVEGLTMAGPQAIVVNFQDLKTGRKVTLIANTIITQMKVSHGEVSAGYKGATRLLYEKDRSFEWELRGKMFAGAGKNEVMMMMEE